MKTTKLIAIAIILGIVSLGYAQRTPLVHQQPDQNVESILIPLAKAMFNADLVSAMRHQLDPAFLETERPSYTMKVRFSHSYVYVIGSYDEWKKFFSLERDGGLSDLKSNLIPLNDAVRDRNLNKALREQVSPSIIHSEKKTIVAAVIYKHTTVYVGGTQKQWIDFFYRQK